MDIKNLRVGFNPALKFIKQVNEFLEDPVHDQALPLSLGSKKVIHAVLSSHLKYLNFLLFGIFISLSTD